MSTTTVHTARTTGLCGIYPFDHDIETGTRYLRHVAFPGDEGHEEGTRPWVIRQCLGCAGRDMESIRSYYRVPAELDMRVTAIGKPGRIVGTSGLHLLIVLDGEKQPNSYHPTWKIDYPVAVEATR